MSAHTPGPWNVPDKYVKMRGCNFLSHVHWDDEEAVANARLIAAAPDLLAALQGVMDILGRAESNASGNPDWNYVRSRVAVARAAITKATSS
jgi:hypothetical protein